jgi:hypothetical protein
MSEPFVLIPWDEIGNAMMITPATRLDIHTRTIAKLDPF